ncbi:outer membrane protein assembly factor BamE [Paraburkholderia sp. GAS448]|uniref:outer membrane protein assembly factor BamE n=1 Tax=Paraburkholderia sp. GAS448 TaxID=3035136 RepID=UPI003D19AA6D
MISKSQLIYRGSRMRGTLIAAAAVAVLAGCSTYDSLTQRIAQSITPYRITVVQGNFVSAEMAAQMKVGMSRAEVKQVLGTPLLTDLFHDNRWDYIFYFRRGSRQIVEQRDFIVNFESDRVASWTGGEDLPSNLELLAQIDGDRTGRRRAATAVAASGASAPVAAASATAPAEAAAAIDKARSPSAEAAAAAAPSTDPNAQAAQAANRATEAVPAPARNATPSVRANRPPSAGLPPNTNAPGQPQFQFRRPPPPATNGPEENPVGPVGPESSAPASAPSQTSTGASTGTGD